METKKITSQKIDQYGTTTKLLASFCHKCGICHSTNKGTDTILEKIMYWYRKWCPGRKAHSRIFIG
jgi:hypothetical protein